MEVKLYSTLELIMKEYFGDIWPLEVYACAEGLDCWGFCEDKEILHLWIGDNVMDEDLVSLIAHELGHRVEPFMDWPDEEDKANSYAEVALDTFRLMGEIKGG